MDHPKFDDGRAATRRGGTLIAWKPPLARLLIAAFMVVSLAQPAPSALAESSAEHGHVFVVTFTKWVTSPPANPPSVAGVSMAGVAGGAVGDSKFAGVVLDDDLSVPGFWLGHARYEFFDGRHAFVADVHVRENDTTNPATARITGVVIAGWLKGATLTGGYTVMPNCPIPTPGNVFGALCFQGTLQLRPGRGSDE